jgi:hypothetical protein
MQFVFGGFPPLQRVFWNFKSNRQKNNCVFGLGSPDLECFAPAGRQIKITAFLFITGQNLAIENL